ncbi:acetyltransferase [Campylobacter jejuni]|uniref:PglD-related sugar-binding protein n=1 Tax=Campylobacter jejuni TaxID=197 RepID=UPI000F8155CD|nr:acetyltransferase [Campylobacter jejuni]MEA8938383.1 acetyltransferase [Campylobacter jejuni]RTK09331.1 acetyltransferase [Campylobacter jejuni]HEF7931699.1 acetyltransferase [Campylobacter jejuni]
MREEILIIGSGGHARSCVDVIELEGKFTIAGFIDNNMQIKATKYPLLGNDDDLKVLSKKYKNACIGVGQILTPEIRINIYDVLKTIGFKLPSIISPLSYVSKNAFIDEASIVMHHALVNTNAKVGKACIINSKALIEHDAIIGDFSHISTASVVNGGCMVEKGSFLGSNTHLKHGQILSKNSIFYNNLKGYCR